MSQVKNLQKLKTNSQWVWYFDAANIVIKCLSNSTKPLSLEIPSQNWRTVARVRFKSHLYLEFLLFLRRNNSIKDKNKGRFRKSRLPRLKHNCVTVCEKRNNCPDSSFWSSPHIKVNHSGLTSEWISTLIQDLGEFWTSFIVEMFFVLKVSSAQYNDWNHYHNHGRWRCVTFVSTWPSGFFFFFF